MNSLRRSSIGNLW